MKVKSIYYKSDFTLVEHCEIGFDVPFKFTYYTSDPAKGFVAYYDGCKYHNCHLDENGNLVVGVENPGMGVGLLQVERHLYVQDPNFQSGIRDDYVSPTPVVIQIEENGKVVDYNLQLSFQGDLSISLPSYVEPFWVKGSSAYQVAVDNGFVGTEEEWLESLIGPKGDPGTVYIPSVSPEGIISWSNSDGKPNPAPRNIKGPKGDDATITAESISNALGYTPQEPLVSGVNIKTINNESILGSGNITLNPDAYAVINLGEQSNYSDGAYTISYDGNLYNDINTIWEAHKIPIITVNLTQHTISSASALCKNSDGVFTGHEQADDGSYDINVNISSTSKTVNIRTSGTYTMPVGGIPKSDLNVSVQASLNKADTAIQYDGGTENSSGVTNVAITIEDTTYYTTNTIYTLNPEESIRYICESVNHNTYIIDADANPKTLLVESNYGEVRFSNTTDSVMHVQGACVQNGDTFTVQISRVGLKDMRMHIVETSTTNLIAQVNTLYRFSSSVNTLNITLPAITDMTRTHEIEFLIFTGDSPSVTFTSAGMSEVRVQSSLVINGLASYELNAMWTGGYWLVAGIKLSQSGK